MKNVLTEKNILQLCTDGNLAECFKLAYASELNCLSFTQINVYGLEPQQIFEELSRFNPDVIIVAGRMGLVINGPKLIPSLKKLYPKAIIVGLCDIHFYRENFTMAGAHGVISVNTSLVEDLCNIVSNRAQ